MNRAIGCSTAATGAAAMAARSVADGSADLPVAVLQPDRGTGERDSEDS
jgi:hypothetical protein